MKLVCWLYGISAVLALTAQPPVSELGNLTATAILGWYAWHTTTRTIPRLVQDFRHELASERAGHRADRDAFLLEMAEERVQRHADHLAMVQAAEDLRSVARSLAPPSANNQ